MTTITQPREKSLGEKLEWSDPRDFYGGDPMVAELEPVLGEAYKGWTVELHHDWDCRNPLKDCDVAWTIRFNRRMRDYPYGTDDSYDGEDDILDELMEETSIPLYSWKRNYNKRKIKTTFDEYRIRAIRTEYLVVGVGLRGRCDGAFLCGDQCDEGIAYLHKSQLKKEGWTEEEAFKYLEGIINELDSYLQGECYGIVVKDPEGEEYESCWGFIGYEYVMESVVDLVPSLKDLERRRLDRTGGQLLLPMEEIARDGG